jgi:hypothetical protein
VAFVGSLFSTIKTWRGIDHKPGIYPYQAGADLWRSGLIPSHDGQTWRLHAGPEAQVVWEGEP